MLGMTFQGLACPIWRRTFLAAPSTGIGRIPTAARVRTEV